MNGTTKRKRGKGYIRIALLAALVFVLIKMLAGVGSGAAKTALVGYGDVRISEKAAGVIVREEKVIKAPISGSITYAAKENQRIPVNAKLVEIKKGSIDTELTGKYNEVNDRLEALQSVEDQQMKSTALDETIRKGLSDIAFMLSEGNMAAVYSQKEALNREINYSLAANTTQSEREDLLRQKKELDEIIEGGIRSEYAPFSGIPVYSVDGYEEVLSPENLEEIIPSSLAPVKAKRVDISKEFNVGDPVMKVVANHVWYAVCSLSEGFTEGLDAGSVVSLEVSNGETYSVRAVVKNIIKRDGDAVVVFEARDYFPGVYEVRNQEITVVRGKYSGLMVPLSAIIEKEGEYLVEVLDADETITKKVAIKGHDDTYAVVEDTGSEPKIKLYDKVLLKGLQED